jgi:hypothetical protein
MTSVWCKSEDGTAEYRAADNSAAIDYLQINSKSGRFLVRTDFGAPMAELGVWFDTLDAAKTYIELIGAEYLR